MTRALLALLFCSALPVTADTRTEVLRTMAALRAAHPVTATVSVHITRKSQGRFANNTLTADTSVEATSDASGLSIRVPIVALDTAEREERERQADPNRRAPTRTALDEIDAVALAESFDFAQPLQHLIDLGKVTAESRITLNGRPVRLVTLALTPRLTKEARSVWNVRFTEDQLRLWIADNHVPIAAERTRNGTAGFMFLRGDMRQRDHWTFTLAGDRLVVTRHESTFLGTGLGQRGEGRTIVTLSLK